METAKRFAVLAVWAGLFTSIACGGDLRVGPGEAYATIQSAIDAAADGDVVIVGDGRWTGEGNKLIRFRGKAITVRSENGPEACVVDGGGYQALSPNTVFFFEEGEGADSVLEGFTITNGNTNVGGGGIHSSWGATPTIRNCVVTGNYGRAGGGIYGLNGLIIGCRIVCNAAAQGGGLAECNGEIVDCIIEGNTSGSADPPGGGGLYMCSGTIRGCVIRGNKSMSFGGGLSLCDGVVESCLIAGNVCVSRGGGLYDCGAIIKNCTIVDNTAYAATGGGGLRLCDNSITNCIVWGNVPDDLSGCVEPTYSCFPGGTSGTGNIAENPGFIAGDYHLIAGSPCIDAGTDAAPGGLGAADVDGNPRVQDGDGDGTAAVDMGAVELDRSVLGVAVSKDTIVLRTAAGLETAARDGFELRFHGAGTANWQIDTGGCGWLAVTPSSGNATAGQTVQVEAAADASGLSAGDYVCTLTITAGEEARQAEVVLHVGNVLNVPGNAATIQQAIDAAEDWDVVVVATGTYPERINFLGKAITVRSSDPEDWDVVTSTVINGQFGGSCVTFNHGETGASVLEGFTLTRGTGTYVDYYFEPRWFNGKAGGGIYCYYSSPTIRRCNIAWNGYMNAEMYQAAVEFGGGIFIVGGSGAVIEHCVITDNIVNKYGSGIMVLGPAASGATIAHCTVANNGVASYNNIHLYYDVDCWETQTIVENTIIWSEQNRSLFTAHPSLVRYCCLQSMYAFAGDYLWDTLPTVPAAEQGNVYGSPGFVAVYDAYDERASDYRLRADSICIDRGDPDYDGAGATDMDGQSRVMGARLDIGADEVMPSLTLERPAGGEIWAAGSRHDIRWRRSHRDRVLLNNADFNASSINTSVYPPPAHIRDSAAACGWQLEYVAGVAYGFPFKPAAGVSGVHGFTADGDLYQLSNDVYKPRMRYTLTVRVGCRSDWTSGITDWLASLCAGGPQSVAARTDETTDGLPGQGEWITATATVTTGDAGVDPVVGQRIGVRLHSQSRVYWDNVQIDVCPLEPETVDVSYSADDGATWTLVEAGVPDVGSYLWTLPDGVDSQDCRVKVVPSAAVGEMAFAGAAAFAIVPYAAGEPVDADWPTLGGDAARRGLSEYAGPKLGCLKWAQDTDGALYQGVAVGERGQVYAATGNGVLTAIDSDGGVLWECGLSALHWDLVDGQVVQGSADLAGTWNGLVMSARVPEEGFLGDLVSLGSTVLRVAVRNDVPVFGFRNFGTAGFVFGSTPANTRAGAELKVVVPRDARTWADVQLYIDGVPEPQAEIYGDTIEREITSVGSLGSEAHVTVYPDGEDVVSHPTVGRDGTIYVGFGDVLYAVGPDGALRWKHEAGAFVYSCPAVDDAGRVFFGSADGFVYALDADGSELWRFAMAGPGAIGGAVLQAPSIGQDGSVYVGGLYKSTLYALDPADGGIRWQAQLTAGGDTGGSFIAAPVVGPDGTLYVTMLDDPHLYALDPADGSVKWATNIAHEPELVGYWKFDEGSGTHAYDSSMYERSAMYGSGTTPFTWVPGVLDGAILRGPGYASRFIWDAGTNGRSVCAWVKCRPSGDSIVRWDTQTDDWMITLDAAGRVRVEANGGYMVGKTPLRDHQWRHVAVTLGRDGPGAVRMEDMRIYVDGTLDASFDDNGGYAPNTSTLWIEYDAYGSFVISESGLPIDDLRLYETALSESQVRELMWDETAPTFTALREPTSSAAKGRYCWTEVAIAADGTIYAGFDDPYLRAINPDGTVRWVKHLACGGNYALTVGADGLVYAAGADGVLYAIRPDGKLVSRFDVGEHVGDAHGEEPEVCELTCPVVAADGTVYVCDAGGRVLAVTAEGCDQAPAALTCQGLPFDMNDDCLVNLGDFAVLASEWMSCTADAPPCRDLGSPWRYVSGYAPYPDMQYLEADVNRDMYVDFNDVEWIMQMWLTGSELFE